MDTKVDRAVDDGGPAFATSRSFAPTGFDHPGQRGMTLRDHYAGIALRALCRSLDPYAAGAIDVDVARVTAETAYRLADAMIHARGAR